MCLTNVFHYVQGSQDSTLHWEARCWLPGSGFVGFSDGLLLTTLDPKQH